jgi:hypothetical protein
LFGWKGGESTAIVLLKRPTSLLSIFGNKEQEREMTGRRRNSKRAVGRRRAAVKCARERKARVSGTDEGPGAV